jgi:exo-1,4-beta-D-glucosaminidase
MKTGGSIVLVAVLALTTAGNAGAQDSRMPLADNWQIQSSAKVNAGGDTIATPGFGADGWYRAAVPSTVLAALVANNVYPDPFFGMNLRAIPGTGYPIGRNFSSLPMPDDSPFRVSWWYRKTFSLPAAARGRHVALHFDGITYRANIWLNGRQIARAEDVAGTFRLYEFDITGEAKPGETNVVAVEVFPPAPDDLAWNWVDWNPSPPDKNMGLFRPVSVTTSGDVVLRHPHVVTRLGAGRASADLTVTVEARNLAAKAVRAEVAGRIDRITVRTDVDLAPGEKKVVTFSPDRFPQLRFAQPRLWWPAEMGAQPLYRLDLEATAGGALADRQQVTFGIREIASTITEKGARLFTVNGRPILIRGGGWAPDMLLRPSAERQDAELRYVRDMRLNTIRLEGKLDDDRFFDQADRLGILVLAGWCCCDTWEQWPKWKPGSKEIAAASLGDQIHRLRTHPSLLAWMNGSDNPPTAEVEQMYLDILKELDWPNPVTSSATAKTSTVTGATGVKMTGPYDWVPPSYWLLDDSRGGAHGFNTETSPGPAVPPVESLRRMLPADHLWPLDDVWNYHAGGGQFRTLQLFTGALSARYGPATGIEDYAVKSQLMAYEGERAMFEAYARNKFAATGVIQWMLNNAWPSMIWHLYDYYLRPGGGYFGTKKACEAVHVQYSYDDRSVVIVNGTDRGVAARLTVKVMNLDASEKFSRDVPVEITPDSSTRVVTIPEIPGLSSAYFVDLRLSSPDGRTLSSNFYWLSTTPDDLDWQKSTWYMTPAKAYANLTALKELPAARVTAAVKVLPVTGGTEQQARITLTNSGSSVAFFIRLQIAKGASGEEVLPVLWEDNYLSLLPGETRAVTATWLTRDLGAARPALVVSGWNVARIER